MSGDYFDLSFTRTVLSNLGDRFIVFDGQNQNSKTNCTKSSLGYSFHCLYVPFVYSGCD